MDKLKASDVILIDDKFIESISEKLKEKKKKEERTDTVSRVYTASQVAFKINKTEATVRRHISTGLLNATKIGKSWMVSKIDLEKYLGIDLPATENNKWQ
jgi:hypothetical protein